MLSQNALQRSLTFPAVAVVALAANAGAQAEAPLLTIAQSGIASNGFSTTWRGQDIELDEDAWLTRIALETASASPNVDEIRLMTPVPNPTTLRSTTAVVQLGAEVEAVLSEPFLLRGGTRYTVWFHQSGQPNATSGCDLTLVDPSWRSYHTNADPTVGPAPGEPNYFWGYNYGTNLRLVGHDNLEVAGSLTIGGAAQIVLEAPPGDTAFVLFAFGTADLALAQFVGPLRLDPGLMLPVYLSGTVGATGTWTTVVGIPNDPTLRAYTFWLQALHDRTFTTTGRFSPVERLVIL